MSPPTRLLRRHAWLGACLLLLHTSPSLADRVHRAPVPAPVPILAPNPIAAAAMPARRALLSDEPAAFQWGLHIDTDVVDTPQGGLRRGTVSNNVIHAAIAMDTGPLGLWAGGRLAMSAMRIASGEASVNNIGDLQVADNLDAHSASRVYQLWYRQRFQHSPLGTRAALRGGLIDLNQNFAATDAASTLLNASFGLNPTLSANIPISTYPKPGLGVEGAAQWRHWQLQLGLYQPNPADRSDGFRHGALVIGEADYTHAYGRGGSAQFKFGLWRYRQSDPTLGGVPARDAGAYLSIEASPPRAPHGLQAFVQMGHAPDPANTVPDYLGIGLSMRSPLRGRPYDLVTAGIAHARIRNTGLLPPGDFAGAETSYELSYMLNLDRYLTFQPDLQYIHHPSGRRDIQDALVALLRLHMEFY